MKSPTFYETGRDPPASINHDQNSKQKMNRSFFAVDRERGSMFRFVMMIAVASALAACSVQSAVLAPRRTPSPDHVAASANGDCTGCHDVAKISKHKPGGNCMGCHRLAPER
jgi:hypothetical protein